MSTFYEYHLRLSGLDVDGRGHCKASALLNHLQNAATLAAEDGGFTREILLERYGAFWDAGPVLVPAVQAPAL